MKTKKKRERGAISVFLAILLVPCIAFTCVFGDLSRVELSKAMAASAADLALYTQLSHYDEKLEQYYGLIGSIQEGDTLEGFFTETENYFVGMMKAEGVSDAGCQLFVEYLRELKNDGYADLLRCDVALDSVTVSPANNSRIGENPALIEDGIVEFMKYRGPIQLTTNLIDRFSELNFEKEIVDAEENNRVVEKKQVYAEKQGELLEKAYYTYLAILQYEKRARNSTVPAQESWASVAEKLKNIRDDLKGVTALTAKYYFPGSDDIRGSAQVPGYDLADYEYDKKDVGEAMEQPDGTVLYCMTRKKLDDLLKDMDKQIAAVQDAGDGLVESCAGLPQPGGDTNEVVYCLEVQAKIDACGIRDVFQGDGKKLMQRLGKLKAASDCDDPPEGSDLPGDWRTQLDDAIEKLEKVYKAYLDEEGTSECRRFLRQYGQTAAATAAKVHGRSYPFTSQFCQGNVTLAEFLGKASPFLNRLWEDLDNEIEILTVAIDGGKISINGRTKTVLSLDTLFEEVRGFQQSRDDWGQAAQSGSSEYCEQEYQLYQQAGNAGQSGRTDEEQEGERIAAQITRESVQELKARLTNIRGDMANCKQAVEAFLYGGTAVKDLRDVESLLQAARTVVPKNTSFQTSAANEAARGYAQSLLQPAEGSLFTSPAQDVAADGNDPNLTHNTPKLYQFLKDKLGNDEGEIEGKIEQNKTRNEEYKKEAERRKQEAKTTSGEVLANKGSDLDAGQLHVGDTVSALSALGSVVSIAQKVASGHGDELRDQLYVCEYIMDMFSYSSFDNEGMYRAILNGEAGIAKNENVTANDFPYSAAQEAWNTEDTKQILRNQSLTNRPITKENNQANLGEVEYVLYGSPSIDQNLTTSYDNILAIRYFLNLISGFCNFYTGVEGTAGAIGGIAASVSTATCGIVPVPLTKCVLIGVLAIMESANDLNRLKKGGRVELYKAKDSDWACSLEGVEEAAFSDPDNSSRGAEHGMYYSDYLYIFLLIGLTSGDKTYQSMLLRVGDLIQANLRQAGEANFSLGKSVTCYQLEAQVRVKPLLLSLSLMDSIEGAAELRERTDWCSYNIKMIRGYS